jgi:hypothetical protein
VERPFPGRRVPPGRPLPWTNFEGVPSPTPGVIVQADPTDASRGRAWLDPVGRPWRCIVAFSLPDRDVFAIDTTSLQGSGVWSGVGTTLFNLAVNPISGAVCSPAGGRRDRRGRWPRYSRPSAGDAFDHGSYGKERLTDLWGSMWVVFVGLGLPLTNSTLAQQAALSSDP